MSCASSDMSNSPAFRRRNVSIGAMPVGLARRSFTCRLTRGQPVFIAAAAIITMLSQSAVGAEEIPGLEVKAAVFTNGVDKEKNFIEPGLQSGIRLKHGPIFLWTVLSGTNETLTALKGRSSKGLPIRHKWTFIGATGKRPERPDVIEQDTEEIKVGTIKRWPSLASEIASGAFDWRTWSGKRHLRPGRYEIRVLSAKGQPMRYKGQECVYCFDFLP